MTIHHDAVKPVGDLAASVASAVVVVSHWSEVVTPIVALLVGVLTLVWWSIRLWDRFRMGASDSADKPGN
jgi:hypothetical protein